MTGFNPRAPCGARRGMLPPILTPSGFNPRAPCGARRVFSVEGRKAVAFQSTRPVRGATPRKCVFFGSCNVSIHAPRAGRDPRWRYRSPVSACFNPRAPCGARPIDRGWVDLLHRVSIHAPRAGRDAYDTMERTMVLVSIHAPRAGRDSRQLWSARTCVCFNPRAPCGARLRDRIDSAHRERFNPRAPCGARQQKKLRLPSFATYLWVLLATNMIFSMSEQRTLLSCAAST